MNNNFLIVLAFSIFLFIPQSIYCDWNCRRGLECDFDCYCIYICVDGERTTECVKNLMDVMPPKYPSFVPAWDMPVGVDFDFSTFPGSKGSYYYYPDIIMDREGIEEDIENALKEWYCLCDYEDLEYNSMVKARFTEDKGFFNWEDRGTLGLAKVIYLQKIGKNLIISPP